MSSLSMNSLSEVIDEITPHSSTKSSTKKYYRRSGINNGYNHGGDKNDTNDYEEKINHNHNHIPIPNPTISFTATSTGTPIIIANHMNNNNNSSIRSNDSPPPSASTSITPTSSIGSARGENNHSINDNNNNNINNDNNNNNNNNEEEVQEKEGEERGVGDGGEMNDDSPSSLDDFEGGGDGLLKRPSQYDNSRNLHVDNLPPITEVEFRSLFLPFGIIARSRIVTDVVTGLPSGYGFVMFEREEDAYRALHSLHNKILPNTTRPLRVTFKKPKSLKAYQREKEKEKERDELLAHGHQPSLSTLFVNTNLYVAGIPLGWKKKELDDIFAPYGTILESRILTDRTTGLSKGVGFVRFQHLESCHNATKYLNGKPPIGAPPDSQNLTVRFAVDRTAQALAVAQQTVMATVGGGGNGGSGSGSAGKGGSDGGKNHSNNNNINMIPQRSYTSHSSSHNNNNINNTNNNNNTNNTNNMITPSPSHLSPSHYLQLQAMIALQHQQQQQMIANRMAVAAAMGGTTDQSISIPTNINMNHSTYLYPFTQSALSMAAAAAMNASTNNPLMITPINNNNNNSSSPSLNVNSLNQYLNASASATTTDPAYYSQVFV